MSGSTNRSHMLADDGFTLVELMVVVLVVGVLIAIALPSFLGARTRELDGAAKQSASLGLRAAKIVYADHTTTARRRRRPWSGPNRRSTTPTASRPAPAH